MRRWRSRRPKGRQRVLTPTRLAVYSAIAALTLACVLVFWSPLQQAILLGPDSLLPPAEPSAQVVVRHGRRVVVRVERGTVRKGLRFPSRALQGRPESYDLYLPPGYWSKANRRRRYPVLYLLHGAPGEPGDWIAGMHVPQMEDQGIAVGTLPPMIVVMPDGNGGLWNDSQYVNTCHGFRAEDLIAHDVVRYIDAHYRTLANRWARSILGISEGGYGAMNLGLKHIHTFAAITSIAGYFAATPGEVLAGSNPWCGDKALMQANSPLLYAHRLAGPRHTAILILDNADDAPYVQDARRFARVLTRWHISHTLLIQPGANPLFAHYWPYFHQAFNVALACVGRQFRRNLDALKHYGYRASQAAKLDGRRGMTSQRAIPHR